MLPTVQTLAADLAQGRTTSEALVREALDRIADPAGEGARAFIQVDREAALAAARASDAMRRYAAVPSPLAGLPVSIKDLFDIAGQTTRAGSTVLNDAAPAERDAPAVARLRAAGAIIVGRSNMTEFAYSGIGANPHYGTPGNPADRSRIPGGSSSGAGVSVGDGMAVIGLGTDTGGSIRIPSALCGVTGFKPTQYRIPRDGGVPLSFSLDSFGPLGPSVACCAIADAILAGEEQLLPDPLALAGLRFAVPQSLVLDDLDATVARAFARAVDALSAAGARITEIKLPELTEQAKLNSTGGLTAPEALYWHRDLMQRGAAAYDQRVLHRLNRGKAITGADYVGLLQERARLIAATHRVTRAFDAVLLPTVAITAPTIAEIADENVFDRKNALILRNTSLGNFLDRCAASLPCQRPDELPVGLMLMGEHGADRRLLAVAAAAETALAPLRQ